MNDDKDDDAVDRLERLGAASGPDVDRAFANRLEADLRMKMSTVARPSVRPLWQPVLAAASLVVVITIGLFVIGPNSDGPNQLVMTAASDTIVEVGEARDVGRPGLQLPDGARVVVGPDGEAIVNGIVLPAGSEAVVVDGELEVLSVPTTSGSASPITAPSITPSSPATSTPTTTPDVSPTDVSPSDLTSPTAGPTTTSSVDRTSASRPSTAVAPTRAPSRTAGSEPTISPAIDLTIVSVGDDRRRLDWTITESGRVAAWRVEVVRGDRIETRLLIRESGARTATIEQSAAVVGYRVVAVTADGTMMATSETVTAPGS
jgi:hypothetical protein